MSRKVIAILFIVAAVVLTVGSTVLVYVKDTTVIPTDTVCYQLPVTDECKPEAVTYNTMNGAQHWNNECSAILAKAGETRWSDYHPVINGFNIVGIIILAIASVVLICVLAFFILMPVVALFQWAFNGKYKHCTYIYVLKDVIR